ncbi:uncharacterized protein [Henckelia pumila]|uniref:uncharacterized protein n=1 Tax=Henckelia pumila TaxID=405737 RepID=UPI003C6E7E16
MEIDNQIVHTSPTLSFGPEDFKGVSSNHNDALVIRSSVANYDVARIFVDSGSSVNVIFQIVSFIIVDAPSAYNVILGRPAMTTFMDVASALHQKMKFPVGNEVGEEVRIEQKVAKTDNVDRPGLFGMEKVNLTEDTSVTAEEEIEEIMISPPSGMVKIARNLEAQLKQPLLEFLEKNKDVFAWSVSDLVGVHRKVAEHKLNVIKGCRPIIQKKSTSILKNMRIDQLVDSTAGHELLSFLDAYQGYHQIPLAKEDKEKVSFVTSIGTYCYVVMPFGLKNSGATYQRLMDKVFKQQIGKNIEVYIDDILVKSRTANQFITDLAQTFQTLKNYQLKLNPRKCTFGVRAGKFLGYMVTKRGIEANPEKVQAIISMSSLRIYRKYKD